MKNIALEYKILREEFPSFSQIFVHSTNDVAIVISHTGRITVKLYINIVDECATQKLTTRKAIKLAKLTSTSV